MRAVIAAVDAGDGNGVIELCSDNYATVLATVPLSKPSFTESNAVLTMCDPPRTDRAAAATGYATLARIKDSNGNIVVSRLTVALMSGTLAHY
jgi:hypothetical protein